MAVAVVCKTPAHWTGPAGPRSIRAALLGWYAREHRDFPWRGTRDPYAVLVSEVMLQQTQASRIAERFPRFMHRFPTAASLAGADPAEVLAEWSGLGYNRRALALQRVARHVATNGWPGDISGLQRLPGVGPYTARALASLAFGQSVGVVDTNVRRWLLRRFGAADTAQALQALADDLAGDARDAQEAAAWTHAAMEFGARVCTARRPRCETCPVARGCLSRHNAARVNVPRQAAYRASDRAYRGALLRALAGTTGHELEDGAARAALDGVAAAIGPAPDAATFRRIVAGLERDELLHRPGPDRLRLGAARIDA
ncbi:MAG: A/G-specific adenine glycosylase [Candidatus Limnocylindria bacterium]